MVDSKYLEQLKNTFITPQQNETSSYFQKLQEKFTRPSTNTYFQKLSDKMRGITSAVEESAKEVGESYGELARKTIETGKNIFKAPEEEISRVAGSKFGIGKSTGMIYVGDKAIGIDVGALENVGKKAVSKSIQSAKGLRKPLPGETMEEVVRNEQAIKQLEKELKLKAEPLAQEAVKPIGFQGFKDLTTKFLDYAKGKTTLSKQEILDFARRPELKKGEADLLNRLGSEVKESRVPAQDFADSIRRDLLELKPVKVKNPEYARVQIDYGPRGAKPADQMGKNYEEVVFESPITTNGSSHYPNSKNYFAHARGDEVVEGGKKIWREQEIQSDLLQKDMLEGQKKMAGQERMAGLHDADDLIQERLTDSQYREYRNAVTSAQKTEALNKIKPGLADEIKAEVSRLEKGLVASRTQELSKLDPFTNDRYGERIMRERIKEKASKGYEKYRLPTGETIGKIEGFQQNRWLTFPNARPLTPENLKIGMEVAQPQAVGVDKWIITDILGDGRFKAVPKQEWEIFKGRKDIRLSSYWKEKGKETIADLNEKELTEFMKGREDISRLAETFDLTGKSNPQYSRYEKWGKWLKNKYGGKEVIDPQGNSWMEIDLKPEYKKLPIEAFGVGAIPLLDLTQEENE